MNYNPKISIITPSWNSERFIEQSILSVVKQNYSNLEYIIVDGGSTDNTLKIIKKYDDVITIRVVSEPDDGLYHAINKGINLSTGEIVKILNSDDELTDNSIKQVVQLYNSYELFNQSEYLVVSSLERIDINGSLLKVWHKRDYIGFFENYLHPTWYVSKNTYLKIGLYDTKFKIASDYDYYMRLLRHRIKIYECKYCLSKHREGGMSENFRGTNEVVIIKKKYKGFLKAFCLSLQFHLSRLLIQFILKRNKLKK